MQEHPLLAAFLQLVGDFFFSSENESPLREPLLRRVAQALLQGQLPATIRDPFSFERIQHFNTQYLRADDRIFINKILLDEQQAALIDPPAVRAYVRETPGRTPYLRNSVPNWARSAALLDSLGPISNRDGRRFWLDVYSVLPAPVQVWMGTGRVVLLLAPDTPLAIKTIQLGHLAMEAGTVWIQAKLFAPEADEKLYCGLRVAGLELNFSPAALNSHGRVTIRPGGSATLSVKLKTPEIVGSEVPQGADARNAECHLPEFFEMHLQANASSLTNVDGAAWKVYGDERTFKWTQAPATYNGLLNAVSIPMDTDIAEFTPTTVQSPVFQLSGAAKVEVASWLLHAAELSAYLPAAGAGTLAIRTETGLGAGISGLLDANQANRARLQLNRSWITAAPGLLELIALETATEYATQTLHLWQDAQSRWNDLRLLYAGQVPCIYQSSAGGTEMLASIADCEGQLDRPVGADQLPFALRTKTSLYLRSYGAERDYVLLTDENMLRDNMPVPNVAGGGLTFQSRAIALNNALLTVSPINAMLLSGELPPQADVFTASSLLLAFALVGYVPTLPDPYAAHLGIFRWMHTELEGQEGLYRFENIRRLLVATLQWKAAEAPATRFIFGDLADQENNLFIHLNPLLDSARAQNEENDLRSQRAKKAMSRTGLQAGVNLQDNYNIYEYEPNIRANDAYSNYQFFSLLDVSTSADLMGVNLGYLDERFIFERSFDVVADHNPISAEGMDVVATGRLVRLFTVPQISWEPVLNKSVPTNPANDPPEGLLLFKDDGPPTLIGNTGGSTVPIAPLPLVKYVEQQYRENPDFKAWSFFSLPFGMLGIARYNQELQVGAGPLQIGATIERIEQQFDNGIHTSLQISTRGYLHPQGNRNFEGMTQQLYNLRGPLGQDLNQSILSATVTDIFNNEFGPDAGKLIQRGVPVERYDFSGYGANLFSHWLNPDARIAQTSQAKFDVWRGRTAHEVIQVRSIIYPWGIKVVRTITMYRNSAALVYRIDSGWRAESDGVYDFKTVVKDKTNIERLETNGYAFHPGIVKGVFQVRNIVESDDLAPFQRSWTKTTGYYIDENDGLAVKIPPNKVLDLDLVPVYFDADVQIDGIIQGGVDGKTPSKRMVGYLQKAPRGVVIAPEDFRDLLLFQNGLGGQVDCLIDIGGTEQTMRLSRVEVQPALDGGKIVFVTAAKGSPVLPKDGSWSVVVHKKITGEVLPISDNVVPLIQRGLHPMAVNNNPLELANAGDLFNLNLEDRAAQFAFLQNTDTQKVLFRNPWFQAGQKMLQSSKPDLADAFRLLDSKGIFPKLDGTMPRLDFNDFDLNILPEGYKLLNKLNPEKQLEQVLPEGPVYFINEKDVKIYIEYANKDIKGVKQGDGLVNFDLDSSARKWVNKLNDITLVVDLLDMQRLFLVRGKFDTAKGQSPSFTGPELEFGEALQPVYDILQILLALNGGDYAGALSKGLKIAMSNSPNNWEYKFQADKEIPVLRFPPPAADSPLAPLRLECSLKLGCYFNLGMPFPEGGLPMPSAGGYVEFGGKLSVMCISVAAATAYAVGSVVLRISADTVRGPGLYLKMGFGVELVVGLPVIGNVSVYYAAGVEISIDTRIIVVGAFILFRGRAELIAGLVTIQIQIEAAGKIRRDLAAGRTDCIAQVTFSLDISIFLVINISFSKSFQENRQIA